MTIAEKSAAILITPTQPPQATPLNLAETKLVHDRRLRGDWRSGEIRARPVGSDGLWLAEVDMSIDCAGIEKTMSVAKDIIKKYSEYTEDGQHIVTFAYERWGIGLPAGPVLDEALSSVSGFQFWINYGWAQYFVGLTAYFAMAASGAAMDPANDFISPRWLFQPMVSGAERSRLITAVRLRGYVLMQQGVGISAPGRPTILHTNGAAHFTDHPEFGTIPGGLSYVDLTRWEGESRPFTPRDVQIIP